jgi:hypothetical protein
LTTRFKSCKGGQKVDKVERLCHEGKSACNCKHDCNNIKKSCHPWSAINHGVVHHAWWLACVKGGMWKFQIAKSEELQKLRACSQMNNIVITPIAPSTTTLFEVVKTIKQKGLQTICLELKW